MITHAPRWEIQESSLAHPARGGPHRGLRRPRAVGLVRALAQRRRRAPRPRLGRQPRARAGGDPHARPPRLRRARLRPVRQRREQRPLERARRQRAAGRRRRARLRWRAAPTSTRSGSPPSAPRSAARCCSRPPPASRGSRPWCPTAPRAREDQARGRASGRSRERALVLAELHAPRAIAASRRRRRCSTWLPRIAPRPVLLIAAGGDPDEIPTNRRLPRRGRRLGASCTRSPRPVTPRAWRRGRASTRRA